MVDWAGQHATPRVFTIGHSSTDYGSRHDCFLRSCLPDSQPLAVECPNSQHHCLKHPELLQICQGRLAKSHRANNSSRIGWGLTLTKKPRESPGLWWQGLSLIHI